MAVSLDDDFEKRRSLQMTNMDWLLIYLNLPSTDNQNYIDLIKIQKGLFLFGMENKKSVKDFYSFIPYLYGPCSFDIYKDLDKLQKQGLVSTRLIKSKGWNCYTLTPEGKKKAESLIKDENRLITNLKDIKQKVMGLSFLELLKIIYNQYPDYASESIVKAEAMNDISGCISV